MWKDNTWGYDITFDHGQASFWVTWNPGAFYYEVPWIIWIVRNPWFLLQCRNHRSNSQRLKEKQSFSLCMEMQPPRMERYTERLIRAQANKELRSRERKWGRLTTNRQDVVSHVELDGTKRCIWYKKVQMCPTVCLKWNVDKNWDKVFITDFFFLKKNNHNFPQKLSCSPYKVSTVGGYLALSYLISSASYSG